MSESNVVQVFLAVALEGFERQLALEPEHTPDQRAGAQVERLALLDLAALADGIDGRNPGGAPGGDPGREQDGRRGEQHGQSDDQRRDHQRHPLLRVKDQLGDDPLGELQQDRYPGDGAQDAQRDADRRDDPGFGQHDAADLRRGGAHAGKHAELLLALADRDGERVVDQQCRAAHDQGDEDGDDHQEEAHVVGTAAGAQPGQQRPRYKKCSPSPAGHPDPGSPPARRSSPFPARWWKCCADRGPGSRCPLCLRLPIAPGRGT